jgi:hypothetical protein
MERTYRSALPRLKAWSVRQERSRHTTEASTPRASMPTSLRCLTIGARDGSCYVCSPTRVWRSRASASAVASSTCLRWLNSGCASNTCLWIVGAIDGRQTRYPAIRAAATNANPDEFAVVPCEAMNQRKQNLVNTGNAIVRITTVSSCRRSSSRIWSAVKLSASARAGRCIALSAEKVRQGKNSGDFFFPFCSPWHPIVR